VIKKIWTDGVVVEEEMLREKAMKKTETETPN